MRKILFIILLLTAFTAALSAETLWNSRYNAMAFGPKFDIKMHPDDFVTEVKIGATASSPWILYDTISFTADAYLGLIRGTSINSTTSNSVWYSYSAFKAGIKACASKKVQSIRPYGEFGWLGVLPGETASANGFLNGIYLGFGMDFFFDQDAKWALFMEINGNAILTQPHRLEKLLYTPVIAQELLLAAGCRFYPF